MPKNAGKQFEEDIKASIPEGYWLYRFKDGTAGFAGEKNIAHIVNMALKYSMEKK